MNAPVRDLSVSDAVPANDKASKAFRDALTAASNKVAPLWPLKHFVAVNPYMGIMEQSFEQAAYTVGQAAGARMTLERSFYQAAIDSGRITATDLNRALAKAGKPMTLAALKKAAAGNEQGKVTVTPTYADIAGRYLEKDISALALNRISKWAAAYFDEGQAIWKMDEQAQAPYDAWHAYAMADRTPEILGLKGFRRVIKSLPKTAHEAAQLLPQIFDLPASALPPYLHRLVMHVGGWSAYARYLVWQKELYGDTGDSVHQMILIRMAWDIAIAKATQGHPDAQAMRADWALACDGMAGGKLPKVDEKALDVDLILQNAFDFSIQRNLVEDFKDLAGKTPDASARPAVQAAFCIDVRSEVFRRAVEATNGDIETIGVAGFFGASIDYIRLGDEKAGSQCPVLLTPSHTIRETAISGSTDDVTATRSLRQALSRNWKAFKMSAVSSFAFVETVGLAYLVKLVTDSKAITRPVPNPDTAGLDDKAARDLGPTLDVETHGDLTTGIPLEDRIAIASGALAGMSLKKGHARLVVLAGHGSTSVNNPHATGLDCGACGGHTGEANARVAVAVLNDPDVRKALKKGKSIAIPDDTVFLAALHDTTVDSVIIYDKHRVPASHSAELAKLEVDFAAAGALARAERAALLNLEKGENTDLAVKARAADWSQVRPEWGLAGCKAFIAAPRKRTTGLKLDGRAFLHNYDWNSDDGFGVLELIMTAPMVVASWISLQYYGSTVDNHAFGSGNKTMHNVVGTIGVLEGNAGDLRTGLPIQSVHDGERYIHEPARLNVMIEAPIEAMTAVIEKHAMVRDLLDNGWLNLFAIDGDGTVAKRYDGALKWGKP